MDYKEKFQAVLGEYGEDYQLKTDGQLIDQIMEFGLGETMFHTADVERIITEKQLLERQHKSGKFVKMFANWLIDEGYLMDTEKTSNLNIDHLFRKWNS